MIRDRAADQITIEHSLPQIRPAESRLRRMRRRLAAALPPSLRAAAVMIWQLRRSGSTS
jgi:hypothetical protein